MRIGGSSLAAERARTVIPDIIFVEGTLFHGDTLPSRAHFILRFFKVEKGAHHLVGREINKVERCMH